MSGILEYFWNKETGALRHPIVRGTIDRQSAIGRTVQSLLLGGLAFGIYSAVVGLGFNEDPIDFFKDTTACQLTATGMGALALGYIVWGERGNRELLNIKNDWSIELCVKEAKLAAEKEIMPYETSQQKITRIQKAGDEMRKKCNMWREHYPQRVLYPAMWWVLSPDSDSDSDNE